MPTNLRFEVQGKSPLVYLTFYNDDFKKNLADDDYYYREKDLDWEINKKRVYGPDDTPPNYDPRQNGYWEEWLKDLFANMKDGVPTLKE